MLVADWGPTKTGKSTFGVSFPQVVVFDFEMRLNGIPKQILDQALEIISYKPPMPLDRLTGSKENRIRRQGYRALLDQFSADYINKFLQNPQALSGFIDTGTILYEYCCEAYIEDLQTTELAEKGVIVRQQLLPIEYRTPYSWMENFYKYARVYGKNLVVTHAEDDQRMDVMNARGEKESLITGKKELKGYSRTPERVDLVLRHRLDNGKPVALIEESGVCLEIRGAAISEPTFQKLVDMVQVFKPEWTPC